MGWKRRPLTVAESFKRTQAKVIKEVTGVAGEAADFVSDRMKDRLIGVKRVSKQDSPSKRDLRPNRPAAPGQSYVRTENGITVKIEVRPFWGGARSEAVQGVYKYLGRSLALERKGLIVVSNKGRGTRARDAKDGRARYIAFADNERLKTWAERENKGLQIRRHAVMISGNVLRLLVAGPSLRRSERFVLDRWRAGVGRGFL